MTVDLTDQVTARVRATATAAREQSAFWRQQLAVADLAAPVSALFATTAPGATGPVTGEAMTLPVPLPAAAAQVLAELGAGAPLRRLAPVAAAAGLLWSRYARRSTLVVFTPPPAGAGQRLLPVAVPTISGETCGELAARVAVTMRQAFAAAAGLGEDAVEAISGDRYCAFAVYCRPAQDPPQEAELAVAVAADGSLQLRFDGARVSPSLAKSICGHLASTCAHVLLHPESAVAAVDVLDERERHELTGFSDRTLAGREAPAPIFQKIRQLASEQPERRALVFRDRVYSYARLYQAGQAVADRLAAGGVGPDEMVAVLLRRGDLPVVAVLGTFLLGAAYIPLDPELPGERLRFLIADSAASAVLTTQDLASLVPRGVSAPTIVLDAAVGLAGQPTSERREPSDDRIAYGIYTSGTTGRPKAVLVTHRAFASTCAAYRTCYNLGDDEVCLQLGSFAFDVFNGDLGRSLYAGGTLVVCPDEFRADVAAITTLVAKHGVTILESTPALVNPLADALARDQQALRSLRVLISSADAWRTEDCAVVTKQLGPHVRVFNTYGVTEAAIDSLVFPADDGQNRCLPYVPIGRPMDGVAAYVLDPQLRLMPLGAPGELYLGGIALGAGYADRAGLTAERFLPDPFGAGTRLYRTGDLVRLRPGGDLEYLGRVDEQLQIRGYRVELGEVESVLCEHPSVVQAAAAARDDGGGSARLIAYVVCGDRQPTASDLRDHCGRLLPGYMVPSAFVLLDKLPLSRNGKVDRRSLPEPATERPDLAVPYVAPGTAAEQIVAQVWADVLSIDRVGTKDDFFASGGHSLLALRVVTKIADLAGVRLPLRAVFDERTVAGLARLVAQAQAQPEQRALPRIRRYDRGGRRGS